jgi:ATP-dependent RNA helicase DDX10/DBP4
MHELSAGLLIGGKDVKEEQSTVSSMNILVATPGRLLQHMDETPGFDISGLQVLVGAQHRRAGRQCASLHC